MKRLVGVGVKSVLIQQSVPQQSVCCLRCCSIFHSGVSIFHPWRHRLLNGPICHPRVLGTEYITPGPGGVVAYIRIQALLPAGLLGNQFLECLMQTSKFSYGSNLLDSFAILLEIAKRTVVCSQIDRKFYFKC